MAGRIAEHKYHGLGSGRFDDDDALDLLDVARHTQRGEEIIDEEWEWSGDGWDIAVVLVEEKPAIKDCEYIRALREYQKKTRLILTSRRCGGRLKRLPGPLLETSRLNDLQARSAIAGEDIFGKGNAQTLRDAGLDFESIREIAENCAKSK